MENVILSPAQSEQLKKCELEMFKAFVSLCEKLGLRYYVVGGTLIGAVRHKGFIPWDDDIDVAMPREDYDRFVREGQALLPEHYFLQNIHTDPGFPANFAKIRDSRTSFFETSVSRMKMNHGVYIDIFVMDYYPQGVWERGWLWLRDRIMRCRLSIEYYRPDEARSIKRVLRMVLGNISRLFYPDVTRMLIKRESMFREIAPGPLVCNYSGIYGAKEIQPSDWYTESCELEFEGLRVKAPQRWHEVLTNLYGDYWQLPPEEERAGHHYVQIFDLSRPYTEYMDEIT